MQLFCLILKTEYINSMKNTVIYSGDVGYGDTYGRRN
jgi:hypothetical protein